MGKETSTDEKQSAREARHSERLERITKRDADNSQTNDDSKDVPDESLSVNAADAPLSAFASVEEMTSQPDLQGSQRKGRGIMPGAVAEAGSFTGPRNRSPRHASLDEEMRPGAVAVAGVFTGPTSPSALGEPRGPTAIDEQSTIMGELAEPYQEDEKLRRRMQELEQRNQEYENVQSRVVTATVIVENNGAGDDDQNAASSAFGRKDRRLWLGAALALLIFVGVILGVVIPLTTNNDKDSPSIDSALTPTQSPAPIAAPTATPAACTSRECLLGEILLQNEISGAEALRDGSSPQFQALRWLANEDTAVLDLDSIPTVILVERYVLAVLYFATSAEGGLNVLHFLSAALVCEWNNGQTQYSSDLRGAVCNEDD